MHKPGLVLLIIGSLCSYPVQVLAGEAPVLFKASYKLYSSGFEIAAMEREMTKSADNQYIYLSTTRTVGIVAMLHKDQIVERSVWTISNATPLPLHYTYNRSKGKKDRNIEIKFDWENGRTLQKVRGQHLEMPLPSGVLDKLLYQYAIMLDAARNQFPVTYHIADGGKMKQYNFMRLADEVIETPTGRITALKLQTAASADDKQLTIWCAPTLNYLPVKVQHTEDGTTTTALLQTVEWNQDTPN